MPLHFSAQTRKTTKIHPTTKKNEILILQETKPPKKFIIFSQKKAVLIFQETETPKKLFIFEEELPKPQEPNVIIFFQKKL